MEGCSENRSGGAVHRKQFSFHIEEFSIVISWESVEFHVANRKSARQSTAIRDFHAPWVSPGASEGAPDLSPG
jgi:hypothetical protein